MPIRTIAVIALLSAAPAHAQEAGADDQDQAALVAEVKTPDGHSLGMVMATATPSGQILVTLDLRGLPPGIHGIHIHETGLCTPPDFTSAGGHLADGKSHGVMSPDGPHPGDLPNLHVPESGEVRVEYFAAGLTPDMIDGTDGAAFVVHDAPDDYLGQPSGNAGSRIGCGVFTPLG